MPDAGPNGSEEVAVLWEAPRPKRWALRRTFSFVLIVSGSIWLVIGLAIRLMLG